MRCVIRALPDRGLRCADVAPGAQGITNLAHDRRDDLRRMIGVTERVLRAAPQEIRRDVDQGQARRFKPDVPIVLAHPNRRHQLKTWGHDVDEFEITRRAKLRRDHAARGTGLRQRAWSLDHCPPNRPGRFLPHAALIAVHLGCPVR